ncbi:hypothetical protein GCM10029964_056720 [Kibdelosporangium lantanae]
MLRGPAPGGAGPAASQAMPEGLSEVEALGFAAAQLRLDPAYAEAKQTRPRTGEPWDFEGSCVRVPRLRSGGSRRSPDRRAPTWKAAWQSG